MSDKLKMECCICGDSVVELDDEGKEVARMCLQIKPVVRSGQEEKVLEAFGKNDFSFCCCCFLKALGVKPK